jgi:regulator-associated protein of mTOR
MRPRRVWDWEKKKRLSVFSNANALGSTVTALKFINQEDDESLALTASSML